MTWCIFLCWQNPNSKEWCFRQVLLLFWNYKNSFSCFAKPFSFLSLLGVWKGEEGHRRQTMTDSLYPYPESSLEHRHLLLPPPPPPPLHMCKRETRRGGGAGYDTAALAFSSLPPFRVHTLAEEKPFCLSQRWRHTWSEEEEARKCGRKNNSQGQSPRKV